MRNLPVPTAILKGWRLRKIKCLLRIQRRPEAENRGEQRSSARVRGRVQVANRSGRTSSVQVRYHAAKPPKPRILFLPEPRKMAKAEESGKQRSSAPLQLTPPIRAILQFVRQRAKAAERDASKSSPLLRYDKARQLLRKPHLRLILTQRKIAKVAETGSQSSLASDYYEPSQSRLMTNLLSKTPRIAKAEGKSPPRVTLLTRPRSWSLLSNLLSRSVGSSFQLHGFN